MHLKLTIEYDGTDFAGSQLQARENGRTVQGELETALQTLAGEPVRVALAGRTDTGVHAAGQVAGLHFPQKARLETPEALQKALNGVLPGDVAVKGAEIVPQEFHARYSARKRAYRYLLWNAIAPKPLLRRYSLHVRRELDTSTMADALSLLTGTHDMASFAGQGMGVPAEGEGKPGTVRTIYEARLLKLKPEEDFWNRDAPVSGSARNGEQGTLLAVDLVANAFLPQMIRTIVGTLLEVGYGKLTVSDVEKILESRDRRVSGPTAKPQGLCLLWVEY